MTLNEIEFFDGTLTLIYAIIGLLVGLLIILKYIKIKNRMFLLVGFSLIGLESTWYAKVVSFLRALIVGNGLPIEAYTIIACTTLPLTISIWLIAFSDLRGLQKRKEVHISFALIGILFEIYLFTFLIIDPNAIGELEGNIDVDFALIITLYQFFLILVVTITVTILARESITSENPEIKLKGIFLIFSIYSFVAGAILEIFSSVSIVILVAAKICLVASALEFYCGFFLPDWVKNLILK